MFWRQTKLYYFRGGDGAIGTKEGRPGRVASPRLRRLGHKTVGGEKVVVGIGGEGVGRSAIFVH